jgi:hypothetical protein
MLTWVAKERFSCDRYRAAPRMDECHGVECTGKKCSEARAGGLSTYREEVQKIVVFGSFLHSDNPHDLDVAVFQDSTESYLPLALKYRQKTRSIARRIPLDILPLKSWTSDDPFLAEVAQGEVVYER